MNTRTVGNNGELLAARWLEAQGYQILERNFFARVGEIDIVARHTATNRLCFIEVKTRKKRDGTAEHANNTKKQAKTRQAALVYCQEQDIDVDRTNISFEHVSVYTHETEVCFDLYML